MSFFDGRVVVIMSSSMLGYTLLIWVSKHVWLIGIACLVMHETFRLVKWHVLTKGPFLACFAFICGYNLLLSTGEVLSLFSSHSLNILGSGHWTHIWDDLKKAWIFSIIKVCRSSLSDGDANILPMKFLCFSKTFMFIPLLLCTNCIILYMTSLYLI